MIIIVKIIIMLRVRCLIHIALDRNTGICCAQILQLMDLVERRTNPCDIVLLEYCGPKGFRSPKKGEKAHINRTVHNTNDGAGASVIMDRREMSGRPDFHDVGDARRLAIILAQRNTQIRLEWLGLSKLICLLLEALIAPEARCGNTVLNGLDKVGKIWRGQTEFLPRNTFVELLRGQRQIRVGHMGSSRNSVHGKLIRMLYRKRYRTCNRVAQQAANLDGTGLHYRKTLQKLLLCWLKLETIDTGAEASLTHSRQNP